MADEDTRTTEPSAEAQAEADAPARRRRPSLRKSGKEPRASGGSTAAAGAGGSGKPGKVGKSDKSDKSGPAAAVGAAKVRTLLARVLWAVCSLFALILALAVLLIALEANTDNELVRWIIARADNVDLGFFDLSNPIKDFDDKLGETDDVKTALFNYGIAAIVWLVVGKFLDKVVRA